MEHRGSCEAVLSAPIAAERKQRVRRAHRREHRVELFLAVRMAMREHGEIAPGEGRLRARQRLETDGGIGNNRSAIGAGDRAMVGSALGRSEEPTSELQSLMRNSYAVFCLT